MVAAAVGAVAGLCLLDGGTATRSQAGTRPGGPPRVAAAQQDDGPVIESIDPPEAYYNEVVAIVGVRFGPDLGKVTFAGPGGARHAAQIQSWTDTRIKAQVPYGTVPGDVVVRTRAGLSSPGFHFSTPCYDKPVVKDISPPEAWTCQVVRIRGCGFGDYQYGQQILFNGVEAFILGNWTETELFVRVPDDAHSGDVVVTNFRGIASAGSPFTVLDDIKPWEKLASIHQTTQELALELRLRDVTNDRLVYYKVGRDEPITVTWTSQYAFEHESTTAGGQNSYWWSVEGQVDPAQGTLSARHLEIANTEPDNYTRCSQSLSFDVAGVPIASDAFGTPHNAWNGWQPFWAFAARGADVEQYVSRLSFERTCRDVSRPDGKTTEYRLEGVDWVGDIGNGRVPAAVVYAFDGGGKKPACGDRTDWKPSATVRGAAYVRLGAGVSGAGFPVDVQQARRAPLVGLPVQLLRQGKLLASGFTDAGGRYEFRQAPVTDTLVVSTSLQNRLTNPPAFRVSRGTTAQREQPTGSLVWLNTKPFSTLETSLQLEDLAFEDATGPAEPGIAAGQLPDYGLAYYHVWQGWTLAERLQLGLDLHRMPTGPVDVEVHSPINSTYWIGPYTFHPPPAFAPTINLEDAASAAADRERPVNREWHEYGHNVAADILGNLQPYATGAVNHAGSENAGTTDSWTEGMAEFYSLLVNEQIAGAKDPTVYPLGQGQTAVNLEINYPAWSFWPLPARTWSLEEFAVAGLLWDLVDPVAPDEDITPMAAKGDWLREMGITPNQPVATEHWPPVHYGDYVTMSIQDLFDILKTPLKLPQEAALQSPDAPADYPFVFDVKQLHDVLAAKGVAQHIVPSGLTALDELFVAHGFFADTKPQNFFYDAGEEVGSTSRITYTLFATTTVKAQDPRRSPPAVPESYISISARDAATGATVTIRDFTFEMSFESPYQHFDYSYDAYVLQPGKLLFHHPDPHLPATARIVPSDPAYEADAPLVVSSDDYWEAMRSGRVAPFMEHTFSVRRRRWPLYLPVALRVSELPIGLSTALPSLTPTPTGPTATPTRTSSPSVTSPPATATVTPSTAPTGTATPIVGLVIRGAVQSCLGNMVSGALVTLEGTGRSTNSVADGSYQLGPITPFLAGQYVLTASADGYLPQSVTLDLPATGERQVNFAGTNCLAPGTAFTATPTHTPSTSPGTPPSPTASETPTATPGTPTETPGAFHDDFCDPASGWPTVDYPDFGAGYVSDAGGCRYRITVWTPAYWARMTPNQSSGGQSFTLEAPVASFGSGAGGLLFGLTSDGSSFYVFLVTTDNRYGLYKLTADGWQAIVARTYSALIAPDWGNVLKVESEAGALRLYIDGTRVATVGEAGDHSGRVGLYAESGTSAFRLEATGFDLR